MSFCFFRMTEDTENVPKANGCRPIEQNGTTHRRVNSNIKNEEPPAAEPKKRSEEFVPRIRWLDLLAQIFVHGGCLYGLFLMLTSAKLLTTIFGEFFPFFVRHRSLKCYCSRGKNKFLTCTKTPEGNSRLIYVFHFERAKSRQKLAPLINSVVLFDERHVSPLLFSLLPQFRKQITGNCLLFMRRI